ncbi:MAG: hypothetical protein ACRDP6_34805 [Actinoallomurus sp.]
MTRRTLPAGTATSAVATPAATTPVAARSAVTRASLPSAKDALTHSASARTRWRRRSARRCCPMRFVAMP